MVRGHPINNIIFESELCGLTDHGRQRQSTPYYVFFVFLLLVNGYAHDFMSYDYCRYVKDSKFNFVLKFRFIRKTAEL